MVRVKEARLQSALEHTTVRLPLMPKSKNGRRSARLPQHFRRLQLLHDCLAYLDWEIECILAPSDSRMMHVGQQPETHRDPYIARESKQLRSLEYRYLLPVVMPNTNTTYHRCEHAIGSDHDSVGAEEANDDRHPRNTLFAFMSG
jgi:hypothetical protein